MPQSFTRLNCHIIFSTKNREPSIPVQLRSRLFAYMKGIVERSDGAAIAVNGMADHVHLLIAYPPERSISEMVRLIKSNSSKWVHDEYPMMRAFAWQSGYSAFSVSESGINAICEYIAEQAEHHRTRTFAEELSAFLKRHGLPDPAVIDD